MLSPADEALAARDPALPGLSGVLDAPALAGRAGLGRMRMSYLLYKPSTSCVAGLVPEDGSPAVWVAATYRAERYAELRLRSEWAKRAVFLDGECSVLLPLPLIRPEGARALAWPGARSGLLAELGLSACDMRLLRFKPGRRVVLRADGPEGPRAVVKFHHGAAAFERARAGAVHCEAAGGARLLSACPARHAVVVGWTPGTTLEADAPLDAFVCAGRALARAHRVSPRSLPRCAPADPQMLGDAIGLLLPGLRQRASVAVARLPAIEMRSEIVIHGDFSVDQVVLDGREAALVDWDRVAVGPPARDLGSALAALDRDAVRGADGTDARGEALVAGYRAAGGQAEDAEIAAHRAVALLALTTEGFRARRPDWDHEAEEVLIRVEALLDTPPARVTANLAGALKRNAGPPGRPAGPGDPVLLRLKPGRRALIRHDGPNGATLGKLRAKGPDRTAPRVQAGMRAAGLDGREGVAVPPVLGTRDVPPVWFQAEVPGTPLGALIGGAKAADAMRRTGRALAVLHATAPQSDRRWTLDDELAVLRRAVADGPHGDLADCAAECLSSLPPAPEVGLHRDFYFDQVIVDDVMLWLVDLDLHARGDAAVDIGNFLAHLTELGLRHAAEPALYRDLSAAFLEGYVQCNALPCEGRIDALHWVSLARHVSIARRFAERRGTIPVIAELCRTQLARNMYTRRRAVV
ncbi:phosphotransferase [Jannaschia formosa]|uniref:phosphotransferase n=1 Tax=Jannaschia formosa TaxID=2259592 RepID=UPI00142FF5F3|nr:phosphotransferase [Jannaschia formosa]